MTCLLFCEHLDNPLAERNISLDLCSFFIFKNLLTFSSLLVQVVFKSFFFITWSQVFWSQVRSVRTFSWFLELNLSSDFGHAETGSGAKNRVVLRSGFFNSIFKVE